MCTDRLVSPNQTGFIPRRNIHENIVVAQEILQSMHKLRGKKRLFAIKVDLEKAYDMISWNFVNNILIEVGIPSKL